MLHVAIGDVRFSRCILSTKVFDSFYSWRDDMRTSIFVGAAVAIAFGFAMWAQSQPASKGKAKTGTDTGWTTHFIVDKKDLVPTGRNPYYILEPGNQLVLEGGDERIVITVLEETKMVDGVETRVVEEYETKAGK